MSIKQAGHGNTLALLDVKLIAHSGLFILRINQNEVNMFIEKWRIQGGGGGEFWEVQTPPP